VQHSETFSRIYALDDSLLYKRDSMLYLDTTLLHVFPNLPDLQQQVYDLGLHTLTSLIPHSYNNAVASIYTSDRSSLGYSEISNVGVD
jgi:hypothetical protein